MTKSRFKLSNTLQQAAKNLSPVKREQPINEQS